MQVGIGYKLFSLSQNGNEFANQTGHYIKTQCFTTPGKGQQIIQEMYVCNQRGLTELIDHSNAMCVSTHRLVIQLFRLINIILSIGKLKISYKVGPWIYRLFSKKFVLLAWILRKKIGCIRECRFFSKKSKCIRDMITYWRSGPLMHVKLMSSQGKRFLGITHWEC